MLKKSTVHHAYGKMTMVGRTGELGAVPSSSESSHEPNERWNGRMTDEVQSFESTPADAEIVFGI